MLHKAAGVVAHELFLPLQSGPRSYFGCSAPFERTRGESRGESVAAGSASSFQD